MFPVYNAQVHIYDLHINKYTPVCIQAVVPKKKARLNHISFNKTHPIIIVGDSRGYIQCLKLSPNLRRQSKEVKTALVNKDLKKAGEMEIKKLDQLLSQVRERRRLLSVRRSGSRTTTATAKWTRNSAYHAMEYIYCLYPIKPYIFT